MQATTRELRAMYASPLVEEALNEFDDVYAERVSALEAEGLTTSDAQGAVEAEMMVARQRHDWAPINASEQECIKCEQRRAIPDDCLDHESVEDCYVAGHGGGICSGEGR